MPANEYASDLELAQLVSRDDEQAFAALFRRHWARIFSVARDMLKCEHLAEEVVQEVFIKIWAGRTNLHEVQAFDRYLFIIARNHIYNTLRRKCTERTFLRKLADTFGLEETSAEDVLQRKQLSSVMEDRVRSLPPQQQVVFRLAHQADMDYAHIGDIMGISQHTVRNHLARAMQTLRLQLRK